MDLDKIQQLLRIVAESDVAEVSVEEDDFKITIRKKTPEVSMQPSSFVPAAYPMPYQGAGYAAQTPAPQPQQGQPQQGQAQPSAPPTGTPRQQSANAAAESTEESTDNTSAEESEDDGEIVRAPLVGTFYRRPAPEDDAFVEVGDTVETGQVLCVIEAMKIMNEIESDVAGRVKEILVDDGESVEYDQPLFVIESA